VADRTVSAGSQRTTAPPTAIPHAELRERVCAVNRALVPAGLVVLAFGNASAVDREAGVVAIKPSGADYAGLEPADIVVISLVDGSRVDGQLRPSSDTPTHLGLYRAFPSIGGVIHTHSTQATAWAQAGRPIPCFGTTHADHFRGPVPVTRPLTEAELAGAYETNTGLAIVERFEADGLDPDEVPGCLAVGHGPFTWGPSVEAALENAIALEQVAAMAILTLAIDPAATPLWPALRDRHHRRKHGSTAYYGQVADKRERA